MKNSIESKVEVAENRASLNGAKILIVDDEDSIRFLLKDILVDTGYEVWEANNAEDALKKIEENMFNILITDIKMPGMSGIELMRKIKVNYPHIEVILISGFYDSEYKQYCINQGATDIITKSANLKELLNSINNALNKKSRN